MFMVFSMVLAYFGKREGVTSLLSAAGVPLIEDSYWETYIYLTYIFTGVPKGLFCEKSIIFHFFPGWQPFFRIDILKEAWDFIILSLKYILFKMKITEMSSKSTHKIGKIH